jgi:hypothetical protein
MIKIIAKVKRTQDVQHIEKEKQILILRALREKGLSIRQTRLTGVLKGVVEKA